MVATPAQATRSAQAASLPPRRSIRSRLVVALLGSVAGPLQRLPDGLLHRFAAGAGWLFYTASPGRRPLVRANLARVCRYLVEQGLVAPNSPVAWAASDERALERLVRSAFRHYVRSYLELLIVPAYGRPDRAERITPDDPQLVEQCFGLAGGGQRAALMIALHYGAIELPGLWATRHGLRVTAPMETLRDADLQAFLERSRAASGLRLLPVRGAGRELSSALERGEVVALVADRLVGGKGAAVDFFGAPTRLPIGPAVLALESGAPAWVIAVRRTGWGTYRTYLERIEPPVEGTRRERLTGFLDAQTAAYERAIALAPEQWWTLFFPIWREEGR